MHIGFQNCIPGELACQPMRVLTSSFCCNLSKIKYINVEPPFG